MASALRPLVQLLIASLICTAWAAHGDELQTNDAKQFEQKTDQWSSPIIVRTWGFSHGIATVRGYVVDLPKREVTETPARQIPQPEFARVYLEEKKGDRETYERIVARFADAQSHSVERADLA